tara:strand:- start:1180 stop:1704 length:525 start_codon:yes stop_codon:yes gene_type:complete
MNMTTKDLDSTEFGEHYQRYIDKVPLGISLKNAYESEGVLKSYFDKVPSEKLTCAYDQGKWTMKEVFQHMIDTERVFAHRLFRLGRMDSTSLPGFDQDVYNSPSGANDKSMTTLQNEYATTRANTAAIIQSLSVDQLSFVGEASGFPLSSRAAAFIILGHEQWHIEIMNERYLN